MEENIRREIYSKGHVARFSFQDIHGKSPALLHAIAIAKKQARVDSTILISGETGVGKELFAQSIHRASNRADGPFVAVNCAALPENLLESELFGYVEGAFTGARRKGKSGLFELAHHGTIFLDEISEIPYGLQGRLLRVLQEREVIRLGYDRVIPIDVRVLCATNRNLRKLVEEGKFRSDLFWRLNVLSLSIPSLRERHSEILSLVRHFLLTASKSRAAEISFTAEAQHFLEQYTWPGNVREVNNFCERLLAVNSEGVIDEPLVKSILEYREESTVPLKFSDHDADIRRALVQSGGSISQAAEILGIHRATLWRRLKRLLQDTPHVN